VVTVVADLVSSGALEDVISQPFENAAFVLRVGLFFALLLFLALYGSILGAFHLFF
jgi:hypothetical protein